MFRNSVFPKQHIHLVVVIKTNQFMLCREVITECSDIHTTHINTLWWQNVEFFDVWRDLRRVIDSVNEPYSCWLCKICWAQHSLHNQHEYGSLTESMTLLKPLQNKSMLLPYEQFHIQSLHQAGKLIPEQYLNDPNPLFQLTFSHPHHTRYKTETVNQQASCKPDT